MLNFKDSIKLTNEMINQSEKSTKEKMSKSQKIFEWEKNPSKEKMTWTKAKEYAKQLGKGWRLPTTKELMTLKPSNNPYHNFYWSSEKYIAYPYFAWFVDLNYKKKFWSSVDGTYYVYCVKKINKM